MTLICCTIFYEIDELAEPFTGTIAQGVKAVTIQQALAKHNFAATTTSENHSLDNKKFQTSGFFCFGNSEMRKSI